MRLLFGKDIVENFVAKSAELIEDVPESQVAIIGIKTAGFFLARRIYQLVKERKKAFLGALDITFWRDDISRNPHPIVKGTEIDFSLDDIPVFLIDDVIFTGRTVRAALCEIFDFGRPIYVRLFTLANRIGREIPVHPDFFSFQIKLPEDESLEVLLKEKGFPQDCGVAVKKGEKLSNEVLKDVVKF